MDEDAFGLPIAPVGEPSPLSLSQTLGISEGDAALAQLHEELAAIEASEHSTNRR